MFRLCFAGNLQWGLIEYVDAYYNGSHLGDCKYGSIFLVESGQIERFNFHQDKGNTTITTIRQWHFGEIVTADRENESLFIDCNRSIKQKAG